MSDAAFQPTHITPSDEQLAIQLHRGRLLLVEANAGAAKTTTLALRIAQALQRGAEPRTVLALTYTAPAVAALKERLIGIGLPRATVQQLRIETFEAFALGVLEQAEGTKTRVVTSHELVRPHVVRAIDTAQSLPQEPYPDELMTDAMPGNLVEGLLKSFDRLKGSMVFEHLDPEERLTPQLADELGFGYLTMRAWRCYEFIRKGGHPDRPEFRFNGDGVYDLARALLSGEIDAGDAALQLGLSLVCVDEMHDVNRAAFTVLKAVLAAHPRAGFVGVGDRDQVIHSQTGADAAFMGQHFAAEIGPPTVLPLTQSRRFSPQLARHVGALARKPYTADAALHTGIQLAPCESHRLAATFVARLAQAHHQQQAVASLRVLLRHPSQSVLIEHELLRLGVPYGTVGFAPYLERADVLLVRGLYACACGDFTGFETAAQRAALLDALLLFSGARVDSIELRHLDHTDAQRAAVGEASASLDSTKSFIEAHVLRSAHADARRRLEAAMAVLRGNDIAAFEASFLKALDAAALAARVFVRQQDAQQVVDNIAQLHRVAVAEDTDVNGAFRLFSAMDQARHRRQANERVVLSSIEAAKGLEFDHVVIPHLSQGEFGDGSTENRNLLYVAMTRARRRLTVTHDAGRPSRFLKDAELIGAT
ncbi:UvrD-helicase domain-containing protein [Roseateles sp. BYS96W]|uniref:DNA 3'-5' helicase n=1 Tax=Pelomonas nitida TaxID=3299027 RepID=A0ABW7G0D9_9BURK